MPAGRRTLLVALGLAVLLGAAYSNHFGNPFEFDDFHTIVDNGPVHDIRNVPRFFTDSRYFGTRSDNLQYRPMVATLNAIDYRLAGGLKTWVFHTHIFLSYLALLVLTALMFRSLIRLVEPGADAGLLAVLFTGFYGLHAANAETINYIISRSDSFSTLCIVASLVLYQNPATRRWHAYLLTMVVGIFTKEVGAVFAPLLFVYILLVEEGVSLGQLFTFKRPRETWAALQRSAWALVVTVVLVAFIRYRFTAAISVSAGSLLDRWRYFYSEWVVIVHYLANFVLPLNLSADPDFMTIPSLVEQRVLLSLALLLAMAVIAWITSARRSTVPIAFGILWYFITLAPTSSFIPIDQLANDHRTFLPNLGLALAVGWASWLGWKRWVKRSATRRRAAIAVGAAILLLHAYGTYQRNIVWSSGDRLWADAARKSPKNGRALMNYGLTLMQKGDYEGAESYFRRTLELMPTWAYIHINMGVVRNARGFPAEAEGYFKNAIRYQPTVPDGYYYYAQWLAGENRRAEAMTIVEAGLRRSPSHVRLNAMREQLAVFVNPAAELERRRKEAEAAPTADGYLGLSLAYYEAGRYRDCIEACEKSLALRPNDARAYNNLCSAYNSLGEWDRAIAACNRALELDPQFGLARNNLKWATDQKKKHGGR